MEANILSYFTEDRIAIIAVAVAKLILGFVLARLAAKGVKRLFRQSAAHQQVLSRRITFYTIFFVFVAAALTDLGFDLKVLLGAAGIFTVAIGFASQTSASNIISGLFLIAEKPFTIGDVIRIGSTTGEVVSIDLLSVKLRTFDNLYVRIPNETLIKTEVTNLKRYPIRRVDIQIGVHYSSDLRHVNDVLLAVADKNPLVLEEPRPLVIFTGYGESSIDFQFSAWAQSSNFLEVKNGLAIELKEAFDREGIQIPFPHRTVLQA